MAVVWLDEAGWEDGDLPDVCMECGAPAPDRVKRLFTYQPPWVWVTILLGLLVLVIVMLVTRKQRQALIPLCAEHKNHWRKRVLWSFLSFLIAVVFGILGVALANLADAKMMPLLILAVVLLCLIGWIVAIIVIQWGTIRATKFSRRSIRLTNVSPDFVDAYDEYCEEQQFDRKKVRLDPDIRQRWKEPRRRPTVDLDDTPSTDEKYRPE